MGHMEQSQTGGATPPHTPSPSDLPIGPDIIDGYDPRVVYPEYPQEKVHASWPCAWCEIRRDEHASEPEKSTFPSLDITDHVFTPLYELDVDEAGKWFRTADGSAASDMEAAAAIWGDAAVATRKAKEA